MAFSWTLINKNFNYPAKIMYIQLREFVFRIKHLAKISKTDCVYFNRQNRFMCSKNDISTLITELTGCSSEELSKIMYALPHIKGLDKHRIHSVFNLLQSLDFKKEDISNCLQIFGTHPLALKNHYMVLEEAGIDSAKMTPLLLYKFISLIRRKISVLKTQGVIEDIDPVTSFASYIGMPLTALPLCDVNNCKLGEIQITMLKAFITWKLDLNTTKIEECIGRYPRLKYKSFRLMKKTLEILENDLGFTKEKIQSHIYLLHADPDNVQQLLKQDVLCRLNPKKLFHSNPKILTYPVENIVRINELIKKREIPEEAVTKVLDIYTLSPDSVEKRLNLLDVIPQFSIFQNHPSILSLVLYQKKAKNRVLLLKKLKMKCVSLHILSTHVTKFDKYANTGEDRTRGDDIVRFLSKQLSAERKTLRVNLNRHPFWYHVSILSIRETLEYLYTNEFTSDDIVKNIHILLYPKAQIAKEMAKLEQQRDTQDELNKKTVLPLILYFIEQPHHFSGGGIWTSKSV